MELGLNIGTLSQMIRLVNEGVSGYGVVNRLEIAVAEASGKQCRVMLPTAANANR